MCLNLLIDEGTGEASSIWTIIINRVDAYKRYLHDLFSLGMVNGLAVLGTVLLICFCGLVRI